MEKVIAETCIKIFLSAAFGLILGIERRNHLHAVGMRTLLLISAACSLTGILSYWGAGCIEGLRGDPTRIAAGVLTGVGFIGGGVILRQGFNVKGITTAAIIWTIAALGLAVGFGMYVQAVIVFLTVFLGLLGFKKIEDRLFPADKVKKIQLFYKGKTADFEKLKTILAENKILVRDMNYSRSFKENTFSVSVLVNCSDSCAFELLSEELKKTGNLQEISFAD